MREAMVQHLRRLIVTGELAPGDQLPTYLEIQAQFGAEADTVRDAMAVLREAGFIETRHRCGTFVTPHPPHLTHFALAFPFESFDHRSRFYEALRDEAAKLRTEDRRVSAFYGVESHVDVDDYQRLLGFVRAHRLAGLVFASNPFWLEKHDSPLIREPGVFRVAIMMPENPVSYPTVYPDITAFLPKAFDYLASRGRKRVAVVKLGDSRHANLDTVQSLAAERGLNLQPRWLQATVAGASDWSSQLALLLLHGKETERPDAVVITDDNLVEGFTAGIRDAGVRVVADSEPFRKGGLEVVAQANFPYPTRSHVPAKRLGYDITRLMATCLDLIGKQRRREDVPSHTAIPAEWEEARGKR